MSDGSDGIFGDRRVCVSPLVMQYAIELGDMDELVVEQFKNSDQLVIEYHDKVKRCTVAEAVFDVKLDSEWKRTAPQKLMDEILEGIKHSVKQLHVKKFRLQKKAS